MSRKITQTNYPSQEEDFLSKFFFVLLFVIAVLALMQVCAHFSSQKTVLDISELQHGTKTNGEFVLVAAEVHLNAKPTATTAHVNTGWQTLSIEGINEVDNTLEFTIEHFSPEAQYRIDYGDGKFREVNERTTMRTFSQAGQFTVRVEMEYKGETKLVSNKKLDILDVIEMRARVAEVEF